MNTYRLIALDLDGTLLNEQKKISEENRKWIAAAVESGIKVMFATGRGVTSTANYMQELGLQAPMVTVNGGEVWEQPGVLLERHSFEPETLRAMLELASAFETSFWVNSVEGIFRKEKWHGQYRAVHCMKFGFETENAEHLMQIREVLESWNKVEITSSHPHNLEISCKGIHKAYGIEKIGDIYGISMSEVAAIGDSWNDLQMIRKAGLGVAMGNAEEDVKQAADVITDTNEENGVARAIRELVLRV